MQAYRTTNFVSLLASIAALLFWVSAASAQTYHLTFDDEFNSVSLSNQDQDGDGGTTYSGTWEPWIRSYPARHLSGEAEEYVDPAFYGIPNWGYPLGLNPFSDSSGILTITAAQSDNANIEGQGYTSGVITSFSSFSQEYGYFEMRAQLPQGAGLWPAFWMLPDSLNSYGDINWNAELDIMECFGAPGPNDVGGGYNQVHWATHDDGTDVSYGNWETINGDIYTAYHIYGMLWTSSTITFYVDGVEIGSAPTQPDENQPMFLLANLALGGSSSWPGPVDNSALPANMNIDYIRAYSNNPDIPAVTPQSGYSPDPTLPISLGGAPAFVQENYNDPSSASSINVSYPSSQTSGDMNIVVVGCNSTGGSVSSVTDSKGNSYSLAIGPTTGGGQRQWIYYAPNISAGSNTVTVTMNSSVAYPDIRVLEYSNVSGVDVTSGANGTSSTANSGSATTTSANDLIFTADTAYPVTTGVGSGFTTRVTTPDGDIAADEDVTSTGSYSGSATLNSSNYWVMQMVAFKASGSGGAPSAPTGLSGYGGNGSVSLSWTGSSGATSYSVYRGTSSGGESGTPVASGLTSTNYVDSSVSNGTTYYYTVKAVNSSGTSGASNETYATPTGPPAFVQENYNDPTSASSISVSYSSSQTSGDLNIVVVGDNTTAATVSSVTDSQGNSYSLAIGPTTGGGQRQWIYYAPNIHSGSNTVTVTMSTTVGYPDIRVLEYSGVSTLDKTSGANGTSSSANSGSATTTTARELIFTADTAYPDTTGVGSGFTTRVTTPDGDIAADDIVSSTGSYSGSATLASSNYWVMQMATFK